MRYKECPCVIQWKQDAKEKYKAEWVDLDINSSSNCIRYRRIISPSKYYSRDTSPRMAKHSRYVWTKQYRFCPFCGSKLVEEKK